MISGQQAENAFRFVLTITPCADQSIEELNRFGAELFEALAKQLLFAALVGAGPMLIVGALVAGLRCQQFFMSLNTFLGSIVLVVGFDAFSALATQILAKK